MFLDNTCVAVLPSLLNKTKLRTTRKVKFDVEECGGDEFHAPEYNYVPKPAQFKVGDVIKMIWNDESETEIFCRRCGGEIIRKNYADINQSFAECSFCGVKKALLPGLFVDNEKILSEIAFLQFLGEFRITSIEKIEMGKYRDEYFIKPDDEHNKYRKTTSISLGCLRHQKYIENFAKEEGFSSPEEMFRFFDEWIDLSTPKELWSYKGEWV